MTVEPSARVLADKSDVKKLEATLELRSVVAISVSAMLGSGIFVLPGLAVGLTGPSAWIAYLVAGLCVLPAGLSKAELATAMPTSGGTYVYVDRTFGPLVGTIAGLGLWLSLLLKSAFALDGFAAYLEVFATVHPKVMALGMLVLVVLLNVVGVRKVGRAQTAVVFTALAALAVMAVAGLFRVEPAELSPSFTDGLGGFVACVAFVFVSYAGVTNVAAVAEEVRNPSRNLPLGILCSLACAMTMYGFVVFVLVGNIPAARLGTDLRPVHTLAVHLGGEWTGILAAVLGVLTMTSMANAGLLSASRFPFAMSRDGLLPPAFERLHPRFLTPVRCIVVTGLVMAAAILTFDVAGLAKLASAFILMIFLIENLAVLVLRETAVQWYEPSYRAPFYPVTQGLGILATLALLWVMGLYAVVAGISIAIPGAAVFVLYSRRRVERRGVLGKLGRRQDIAPPTLRAGRSESLSASDVAAASIVALLGHERSPETLVEMGAALADRKRIRVLHVVEIPDQTLPEALCRDDGRTRSLRRRVVAMAEDRDLTLDFESLVSRDIVKTVNERTRRLQSSWLVMAWRGRRSGAFLTTAPLGWLTQRLACNFAVFHDAGVRYIREILAHVEPGPHDALVVSTADHLARIYDADVTLARFVPDRTPLPLVQAQADYLDQLRGLVSAPVGCRLLRGSSETQALLAQSVCHDLIVLGAPPERRFLGGLRGSLQDRVSENAACSVLQLRMPRTRAHDDEVVGKRMGPSPGPFRLLDHLDRRCVGVRLAKPRKEALFDRFAATFADALPEIRAKDCVAALWEREKMQNTSVGRGVAMPHATLAAAERLYLGVFTLATGIDYAAIDGRAVDVFFVTLGPPSERQTHLRVLGGLAALVLETDMLDRLRRAETAADIVAAVRDSQAESEAGRTR